MRIICSQGPAGNVYRIYRKDAEFVAELRRIIPFLNECAGSVLIGGGTGDSGPVLTVPTSNSSSGIVARTAVRYLVRRSFMVISLQKALRA